MPAHFHFIDRVYETLDPRAADLRNQTWQGVFVNLFTAHSVLAEFFLRHGAEHSERSAAPESSKWTPNMRDNIQIRSNSKSFITPT